MVFPTLSSPPPRLLPTPNLKTIVWHLKIWEQDPTTNPENVEALRMSQRLRKSVPATTCELENIEDGEDSGTATAPGFTDTESTSCTVGSLPSSFAALVTRSVMI